MDPQAEIELESATIRLREDGIVHIVLAENIEITVESAKALHAARRELGHAPRPLLVDIRPARGTNILTMRYTTGTDVSAMTTRLALLVGSPVSRMLGSVFLGLTKPPYPTRLFTDEDAAISWLLADSAEDVADDEGATKGVDDGPAA